jgi:transposase
MIVRIVKLKPTKAQEATLNQWLWNLTGLYNFAVKKIEHDAADQVYHSAFDFVNLAAGHSERMEIPSHTMQGILKQAYAAWQRCFKNLSGKPKLKGQRNKLNSIPFPDPIKQPGDNHASIPGLGAVRYHKQELPVAKIKCGRIIKKASGWYLCLWLDCDNKFPVKDTAATVGIDPGFKTLLTLSDGTKIENPRELRVGAQRLGQSQRGGHRRLTARLLERQANRRNDRNHKISRKLVEGYKIICYSADNFKGIARRFGKSVTEAGHGNLIGKLAYKCRTGGRELIAVESKHTTMTCGECGALTGPAGLRGLAVRQWECSACGASLDRDRNSANVILAVGLGTSHEGVLHHAA